MKHLVAPSLLSADFLNLERDIRMVNRSGADWFHLDIMDGLFVPNISFGFPVLERIRQKAEKPLDVHLMIVDPDRYTERFVKSGASVLTVHYEACNHLHRTLEAIRFYGAKAGVVLNPHTPVHLLEEILPYADLVLLMSVNPGFGGQKFIGTTLEKISRLKEMILRRNTGTLIEVDGGVDFANASHLVKAGADVLVAGNTIFSSEDPVDAISRLKNA